MNALIIASVLCLVPPMGAGQATQQSQNPQNPQNSQNSQNNVPAVVRRISFQDYLTELNRIRGLVEALDERRPAGAAEVLAQVPSAWHVTIQERDFDPSGDWIRRALVEWRETPTRPAKELLIARLRAVRAEAARYLHAAPDATGDRARLGTILEAREFRDLAGPSWLDRLRQRALSWFVALLTRMLGASSIPTITNALVYVLIALVLALASAFAYRSLRRSAELDSIGLDRVPAVARPWGAWLTDARAAAAKHDWPEAVHLAYWCGIAFLESRGAWRPDRSRTPREYLRVLGTSHEHRPALQALTRELEHVWYAAAGADASRFETMLSELERLGCPSR